MNSKVKEDNLHKFKTHPKIRVFLVSLKCGSTGLNLTVANHVIMCDIWWNPAVESQAIDRSHRIVFNYHLNP
jgi:SNF2 family DNA or RNA helicase